MTKLINRPQRGLVLLTLLASVAGVSVANDVSATEPDCSSDSTAASGDDDVTLGVTHVGSQFPFPVAMVNGMEEAADELGVNLIVTEAGADPAQQASDIEDLLSQDVDGIILNAVDNVGIIPSVEMVIGAGVPILASNTTIGEDNEGNYEGMVGYVGMDERQVGRNAGELAIDALDGAGKVLIIEGAPGFFAATLRTEGFTDAIADSDIEIVASQPGNWLRDEALTAAENLLQANPDVDLIYAHDDNMAIGAAQAVREAGLADTVRVIGIGGSTEGIDAIAAGDLYGTIFYSPIAVGRRSVEVLVNFLRGDCVEEVTAIEAPPVTEENVADFVGEW